jgi:hypothetical protein
VPSLRKRCGLLVKYQVPSADAIRTRDQILNAIFKLVESQQRLADADLEYLAVQGRRYHIARSDSPESENAVRRIELRQAIQSWDAANYDISERGRPN